MPRNPFDEIERMFDRMSRQFEGLEGDVFETSIPVDVRDAGDGYVVTADLPGFEREDIDVELAGNRLTIAAEHTEETEETEEETGETEDEAGETRQAEGRYIRRERRQESISRTVRLPEGVDEEDTAAEYHNGVLTITLSKRDATGGRNIPIN